MLELPPGPVGLSSQPPLLPLPLHAGHPKVPVRLSLPAPPLHAGHPQGGGGPQKSRTLQAISRPSFATLSKYFVAPGMSLNFPESSLKKALVLHE